MSSLPPAAPSSGQPLGTPDMADNISSDPADDHPLDEATSAADADWLAALRAKAREKNTTLAELVADDATTGPPPTDDAPDIEHIAAVADPSDIDDEPTIGSPNALEDIRRMAREERDRAALLPPPPAAPTAARTPSAPPTLRTAPTGLDAPKISNTAPRWEAPPRLETASQVAEPAAFQRNSPQRNTDWRLVAVATVAAMLLGIVITLVFFREAPANPVDDDPDVTTVDDGSAANGAITGEPEIGS